MSDDALFHAEIARRWRQRFVGVWLCAAMVLLMSVGVYYSVPMMHGSDDWSAADATIVAVARDPESGELEMTSEFTDAEGVRHRDTETEGYHYAPGEPKPGQSIEYLYKRSEPTGDLQSFPRADRILQWVFGIPLALFVLMGAGAAWLILRERKFRLRLLREGRREPGQAYRIAHRSVVIPGARTGPIDMWRLEARYFEPSSTEFIDCHSAWQGAPAPTLGLDTVLPPILVDPQRPSRYWLPATTSRSGS